MSQQRTAQSFENDIVEHVASEHRAAREASSGDQPREAFNVEKIRKGLDGVNGLIQKVAPILTSLAPPEYQALIKAFALLVNSGDAILNPAK